MGDSNKTNPEANPPSLQMPDYGSVSLPQGSQPVAVSMTQAGLNGLQNIAPAPPQPQSQQIQTSQLQQIHPGRYSD